MPIDAAILFFYRIPAVGVQAGGVAGQPLKKPCWDNLAQRRVISSWSVAIFMRARARALHHPAQVSAETQNLAITANGGRPYAPWPCTQAITVGPQTMTSSAAPGGAASRPCGNPFPANVSYKYVRSILQSVSLPDWAAGSSEEML